jgi:hypothetical protein
MNEQADRRETGSAAQPEEGATPNPPLGSRRTDHFAERERYAYLFHLWAEPRRAGQPPVWRFSLEEVETGVRHGFGNFEALVKFLQQRMAVE